MKLWDHQAKAVQSARGLPGYAVLFEQGCGKTATIINILKNLISDECRMFRILIICPPIVVENWAREIAVFSDIPSRNVISLKGPTKKRIALMQAKGSIPFVAITNYEAMIQKPFFDYLMSWKPEVLVLDESHYIKDPKAKRTKALIKLSDKCKYVYLSSGTPILNSPMDIFSQWRAMDGGRSFGKSWWEFRGRFFVDTNAQWKGQPGYFPQWEVREGAIEEIKALIANSSMRVEKKDCLDLPPLVRQVLDVELSQEQKSIYKQLKDDFIAFTTKGTVVASMALTKMLRLQQLVSGVVRFDDNSSQVFHDCPRAKALEELLVDLTPNHKVIVWAVFKENYEIIRRICEKNKITWTEVHGEVSNKQAAVDRFNQETRVRVLIGHPGAGGIGINLVSSSYSIFYSRTHSLGQDLQARARNHRGGSEIHDKITHIDLVARNTVDEGILLALSQKMENADQILSTVKEYL